MASVPYYTDFYLGFLPDGITGDIIVLEDADSIKQGVENIVLTNFYERFQRPNLGTNTIAQLFENLDAISASIVKSHIQIALENFAPYAKILSLLVTPNFDENAFAVSITFGVVNLSNPIDITFFLRRIR